MSIPGPRIVKGPDGTITLVRFELGPTDAPFTGEEMAEHDRSMQWARDKDDEAARILASGAFAECYQQLKQLPPKEALCRALEVRSVLRQLVQEQEQRREEQGQ